jgi:DNA-directed RNA polymerase specialized sigma subunit
MSIDMKTQMSEAAKQARAKYQRQYVNGMSEDARQKANEYQRKWRLKNQDKTKQYNVDYWERKAKEPESIESQIISLHDKDKSLREIGQIIGISHMKVKRILATLHRVTDGSF